MPGRTRSPRPIVIGIELVSPCSGSSIAHGKSFLPQVSQEGGGVLVEGFGEVEMVSVFHQGHAKITLCDRP